MSKNKFTRRQLAVIILSSLAAIALVVSPWIGSEFAFATVSLLLFASMYFVLLAVERNGLSERQKLDKLSSKLDRAREKLLSSKDQVLTTGRQESTSEEAGTAHVEDTAVEKREETSSEISPEVFHSFAKFLEDVDGLATGAWISATQIVSLRRIDRWLQPDAIYTTNSRLKDEIAKALGTEVNLLDSDNAAHGNARLLVLQRSDLDNLNEALTANISINGCALAVIEDGGQNDAIPAQYVEAMPFDLLHKVKFYYPADLLIDEQVLNSKDEETSNYDFN